MQKGSRLTPEQRARVSEGMTRHWDKERRPWLEVDKEIMAALDAGDTEKASRLRREYVAQLHRGVLVQMNKENGDA